MERRKANSAYVKLRNRELLAQDSSDGGSGDSVGSPSLQRTRSMRASFRLLKGKLHTPQALLLQSPFKRCGYGQLSLRGRRQSEAKVKAIKELSELDTLDAIVQTAKTAKLPKANMHKIVHIPQRGNNHIKDNGVTAEQNYCDISSSIRQDNKEQIEALISQLPFGSVPRKACRLLQIPEDYCANYKSEKEKQNQQQQQQKQQENIKENRDNVKIEESEVQLSGNQSDNFQVKKSFQSAIEIESAKEKQLTKDFVMSECQGSDFYEKISQAASTGIYGTTRMKTATIRKPMPYLNSHNILPTTNILTQYEYEHHLSRPRTYSNDDDDDDRDHDQITPENFVILRKPTTTTTTRTTSAINHNSNNCLKYYNNNDLHYNKSEKKNNFHKSHQSHQNTKPQHNHELPSSDQFERDNPRFRANYNNNNNKNNNSSNNSPTFRWSAQQLSNNASVAKIRTAISSCTTQDLRDMEFLLPQHHAATSANNHQHHKSHATPADDTTNNNNNNNNNKNNNNNGPHHHNHNHNHHQQQQQHHHHHQHSSIVEQASKLLQISRHSHQPTTNTTHHNDVSNHVKLKESHSIDDNSRPSQMQSQNLTVHRQPAHARTKCGSTPPHRTKMSKKQLKLAQAQLDKLTQINLHLHALFSAVEHGHLDKARTILESTDVDVNSINADGLSALDVSVLSNNRPMTKMLLQHGAIEGSQYSIDSSIGTKLNGLLKDAESRIHDLSGPADTPGPPIFTSRPSISSIIIGNSGSSVTGCTGNEIDKQIGIWERRVKGLRRMLLGWEQTSRPDAPASVIVDVTGENSIALQILEPFEGAIGTKFKVQWSTRADFSNVVGEREIIDWTSFHGNMGTQCNISGLTQGRRYFVRAACGNIKGWGPYKTSVPASVVPSSWRDLNNREDRYLGRQRALDNLFTAVRLARPADVSELSLETTNVQRRNPKKKTTIKQLFSVASKFQKNLRRGIYLASIMYCEDKVLVTSEDFLPVIEIDETYPSSLQSDYHWLMKVACTWDDVKSLRTDMERNLTSAVHFRTKLLSAICQMQSALGLNDLGQLYYKPFRDSHGTVVLTCIQCVRSQKSVSILNSRWLPVNKLQKKVVALLEDYSINDMLISSVSEQIHYHQASMQRLAPGLYLGYLKLQCSVDQIQVVVPSKTPNVLPHYKVRDNSHITAEEWQILKRGSNSNKAQDTGAGGCITTSLPLQLELSVNAETTTEVQRLFLYDLTNAAHKLFTYMNIKPEDAMTHRLYDIEVIEHSKDISFLIICPSVELTCAAPGQSELLLQRDDLASLSIQAFEMIHLRTYQTGIIQKYARLSCILELDTALANHSQREAFSTSELQTAKERLAKLQELSANLNLVWKSVRWLMDVIAFARDKTAQPMHNVMREILDFSHVSDVVKSGGKSSNKQQLLQLPIRDVKFTKTGSGRGSWPGPASNTSANCMEGEHSKSEQNLGCSSVTPTSMANLTPTSQMPTATTTNSSNASHCGADKQQLLKVSREPGIGSDISLRKNSGDSAASPSYYSGAESGASSTNELGAVFAIPPSRSEDTLAANFNENSKYTRLTNSMQRKRTSSNITHTNTTTPLIKVHSSSSAPYLAHDPLGSNSSLKSTSYNISEASASTPNPSEVKTLSGMSKTKAASSTNLRDTSGHYLKTTLSALQQEIKTTTADERVASSTKSLSRQSSEEEAAGMESASSSNATNVLTSGIIQVYTAYNTGLASGTSLKLHVTPRTTAREVINLVVKQLNMAAVLKGNNGPIYTTDMLDNFCLVAVIGARERCLRDDFKPLQLQNPWKKGRLYVRQKHELLAAIEHSNRKSHLI